MDESARNHFEFWAADEDYDEVSEDLRVRGGNTAVGGIILRKFSRGSAPWFSNLPWHQCTMKSSDLFAVMIHIEL